LRLAGGEAEGVFAVEAEQEVDPAVAEGALAVEDYDFVIGEGHGFIVAVIWTGGTACPTWLES
jgi:hypothetical protein